MQVMYFYTFSMGQLCFNYQLNLVELVDYKQEVQSAVELSLSLFGSILVLLKNALSITYGEFSLVCVRLIAIEMEYI